MPRSSQKERYAQATIQSFVAAQKNQLAAIPLVEHQISTGDIFKDATRQPEGPLDLLYRLNDERETAFSSA